jgi:hypothetical protein
MMREACEVDFGETLVHRSTITIHGGVPLQPLGTSVTNTLTIIGASDNLYSAGIPRILTGVFFSGECIF